MATTTYLLTVFHFAAFYPDKPSSPEEEGYQLSVLCQAEPILVGLAPGTPLELCLKGELVGAGLPCVFLTYKADLWNRPVGRIFRDPIAWPLVAPIPVVQPFLSITVPRLVESPRLVEYIQVVGNSLPVRRWRKV